MLLPHDIDWHEQFMQAMTREYASSANNSYRQLHEKRKERENEFCDMEPNYDHFFA